MKAVRFPLIPWSWAWGSVAIAFPWSNSFMSVATGMLAVAAMQRLLFPSERQHSTSSKWLARCGWALILLVFWSGLSFFWGGGAAACIHDVRVKLPLAAGGLAMLAMSRERLGALEVVDGLLKWAVFSAASATAAMVILDVWDGGLSGGRQASRFISHIRFGLWWALLLPWVTHRLRGHWIWVTALGALVTWYWLQCLTGLIVGALLMPWWGFSMVRSLRNNPSATWPLGRSLGALFGAVWGGALLVLLGFRFFMPTALPDVANLPSTTVAGEAYVHKLDRTVQENGEYVWTRIAWGELNHAWAKRSQVPVGEIQGCLIRFLASKGLPKDREGVVGLSDIEIKAIEEGIASAVELEGGSWEKRWNRFVFNWGEWWDGRRSPNASILARSVYMEVAFDALGAFGLGDWIAGTGVGSFSASLEKGFVRSFPGWPEKGRNRPHNQFLTLVLSLGLVGVSLWLYALYSGWSHAPARPAILLVTLSCLTEDTIETQAGVTLVIVALAWGYFIQEAGSS